MRNSEFYIIPFRSSVAALKVEKELKDMFVTRVINTPHELAAGCGASLRIDTTDENQLIRFLIESGQSGTLYKMKSRVLDGDHPIEEIVKF
jgi:hypothetical protein